MNNSSKSKQCPRCRFPLTKTYTQKMICKRCGYTSNKLQIVSEEDTYNANIHFSRKIHVKKEKQQAQIRKEDSLETYLKYYQHTLRYIGNMFFNQKIEESVIQRQKLINTYKNLWFDYLQRMSRQGNVISGIFTGLIQKTDKKLKGKATIKTEKKQQQSDSDCSDQQKQKQEQKGKQEQNQKQNKRTVGEMDNKTEIASMKQNQNNNKAFKQFKKIINSALKRFKSSKYSKNRYQKREALDQVLQRLLGIPKQDVLLAPFSSVCYVVQKYALVLGISQCRSKKSLNKYFSQNKLVKPYIRQEDLKGMCQKRNLSYEKRRLCTQLTLLTYQLLLAWYKKTHKNSIDYFGQDQFYPYPFLLEAYKYEPTKPPLIEAIIRILETMSQEALIKTQENQKRAPELSLKFICSLIYLSCLKNQKCFTILQIINHVVGSLWQCLQQNQSTELIQKKQVINLLVRERNMKVRRVRKICHQVLKYVEGSFGQGKLFVQKWCQKFSRIFSIPEDNQKQFRLITQTLVKGHIQQVQSGQKGIIINGLHPINNFSDRLMIIQQPEMVLSSLLIYLKLYFGFDRGQYPYLKRIGEVWEYLKENRMYVQQENLFRLQYLQKLVKEEAVFNLKDEGQIQFGLQKLLKAVAKFYQPSQVQQQLKNINFKSARSLSDKVRGFRSLFQGKERNTLSLMYNINSRFIQDSQQSKKPMEVLFVQKRQNQKMSLLFRSRTLKRTLGFRQTFVKALDFLYEKQNRFNQKRTVPNQVPDQGHGQSSQNNESDQFIIQKYLDKPQAHYEIVYHPTINTISNLKLNQLLAFTEGFSLHLNGQHTDCKDILEWMGLLQSVLKQFQL